MKKVILSSVSILLLLSLLAPNAGAACFPSDFSSHDLRSYGLPILSAYRSSTPPKQDGEISPGEYPGANGGCSAELDPASGLFFSDFDPITDYGSIALNSAKAPLYRQMRERIFISYDSSFVYLGVQYICPADFSINPMIDVEAENSPTIGVNLFFGLPQSGNIVESNSTLRNTYYFDFHSLSCRAVSGIRTQRFANGDIKYPLNISTRVASLLSNGTTASDGVLWNGEKYRRDASFSKRTTPSETVFTFEVKLPFSDLLLTVSQEEREAIHAKIKSGNEIAYGSFLTAFTLDGTMNPAFKAKDYALSLVSGIPIRQSSFPSADGGKIAWESAIASDFAAGVSKRPIDFIPIPVWFLGNYGQNTVPAQTEPSPQDPPASSVPFTSQNSPANTTLENGQNSEEGPSGTDSHYVWGNVEGGAQSGDPTNSSPSDFEFDFSPSTGEDVLETVYDSSGQNTDTFNIGNLITLLSAVLFFLAVVILLFVYRSHHDEEHDTDQNPPKTPRREEKQTDKKNPPRSGAKKRKNMKIKNVKIKAVQTKK